jgi:hypothetical protein
MLFWGPQVETPDERVVGHGVSQQEVWRVGVTASSLVLAFSTPVGSG